MKILLVGEYSRLHNSLKEGLTELGHEVIIIGTGDYFKNLDSDYSIAPKFLERNALLLKIVRGIHKITGFDLLRTEKGLRFTTYYLYLKILTTYSLLTAMPLKHILRLQNGY